MKPVGTGANNQINSPSLLEIAAEDSILCRAVIHPQPPPALSASGSLWPLPPAPFRLPLSPEGSCSGPALQSLCLPPTCAPGSLGVAPSTEALGQEQGLGAKLGPLGSWVRAGGRPFFFLVLLSGRGRAFSFGWYPVGCHRKEREALYQRHFRPYNCCPLSPPRAFAEAAP